MLAIWSLVLLPFLKPAWTSGSSWFRYCWSLAWRIGGITFKFILNFLYMCMPNMHIYLYVCVCVYIYIYIYFPEENIYFLYLSMYCWCFCLVFKLCLIFCDPMDHIACQAPLPMGFSRQKYWCGLPFPSPRDLNDPGIKHTFLYWQVDYLPLSHLGSPYIYLSPRNCCPDLICKYIENRLMKTFRNL